MEQTLVTPGGVTIYHDKSDRLHGFCISLYVKAGLLYESKEENGITHFLEHIVFRNINERMDDTLYRKLDQLGLNFNAATYKEFIDFTITGASKHFLEAVKIITQIFAPITLSEGEIDVERKRIIAEIREEEEEKSLAYYAKQKIWKGTSLKYAITGKKKILAKIHKKELNDFKDKVFGSDNIFFYITGNFPKRELKKMAKEVDRYPLKPTKLHWDNVAPIPKRFCDRKDKVYQKKGKKTEVYIGIDIDKGKYDFATIQLLYDILFEGDFCKVNQRLSEKKGYVYSYEAWLEQYKNIAHFHLIYEVEEDNKKASIEEVLAIFEELKKGITDELDYVKPYYVDNGKLILDDAEDYNWSMAFERHLLGLPYSTLDEKAQYYDRVTPEQMTEACQEILIPQNLFVAIQNKK